MARFRVARMGAMLAVAFLLAGCQTELYRNLSAPEANELVAVLLRAGIPASREADQAGATDKGGTLRVMVEESRFADAVDLLRSHGLPHPVYSTITQIFKGDGLVTDQTDQRARYTYALQESLAGTISQIDGVLSAQVQIALPDNDALRRDPTPASASVLIRHAPQATVGDLVPQIKQLVANGVGGLNYDKVSVMVVPAAEVKPAAAMDAGAVVPVFGLWVHRDSARALELVLGGGAALVMALGGIGGWLAWRARADLLGRRATSTSIALR